MWLGCTCRNWRDDEEEGSWTDAEAETGWISYETFEGRDGMGDLCSRFETKIDGAPRRRPGSVRRGRHEIRTCFFFLLFVSAKARSSSTDVRTSASQKVDSSKLSFYSSAWHGGDNSCLTECCFCFRCAFIYVFSHQNRPEFGAILILLSVGMEKKKTKKSGSYKMSTVRQCLTSLTALLL